MNNIFHFRTLLQLRQEDSFFSLLKKDKLFELFMAFLHEAYDEKENKELAEDVFLGLLGRFFSREAENIASTGMDAPGPENALRLMMSDGYRLVTRNIVWDASGQESSYTLMPTEQYADVVRLVEERSQYTSVGTDIEIEDTIRFVSEVADMISGDVEKQKEGLKKRIALLQAELRSLEETGLAKPLSDEEVHRQVAYVRKRVNGITSTLANGTSAFRKECEEQWKKVTSMETDRELSDGEVTVQVLDSLGKFMESEGFRSYENALHLLINPEEQRMLGDSLERIMKNPEAGRMLREDGINLKAVLRKIVRDSSVCHAIMRREISKLNAHMRAGEIEKNRLLYKKADEILLRWQEIDGLLSYRYRMFPFVAGKPDIVSAARATAGLPKPKPPIVRKNKATNIDAAQKKEPVIHRDIRDVKVPEKFRALLDRHGGKFTLYDYVKEEGTAFGVYEFLSVRAIMSRYMGREMLATCLLEPKVRFVLADLAPTDGSGYREIEVSAHSYEFNEEAYNKWKKDRFRF